MPLVKNALDTSTLREFRNRLRVARTRLLRTVATTEAELAALADREPGAPIEDAARQGGVAVLARLDYHERRELEEIHDAYAKLATGTFGVCEGCGSAIPFPRLRVMPTARLCVTCQATQE
jgi:DnaK suppressor protein